MLSECVGSFMSNKEKHLLQFQVVCFPHGYDHYSIFKVVNSFLLEKKLLIRDNGGGNIFCAQTLKDVVIHFLSEPFLFDEGFQMLGEQDYATDDYVVTSFSLNLLCLVISK